MCFCGIEEDIAQVGDVLLYFHLCFINNFTSKRILYIYFVFNRYVQRKIRNIFRNGSW